MDELVSLEFGASVTDLTLSNCPKLANISGSEQLVAMDALKMSSLPLPTQFDFSSLESVSTKLTISDCGALASLHMPQLASVTWLALSEVPLLSSLELPSLVAGWLEAPSLPLLASLSAPLLASGGVQLEQSPLSALALPALCDGSVLLQSLPGLASLSLPALANGSLSLQACPLLPGVDLPSAQQLGELVVEGCELVGSVSAPRLTRLGTLALDAPALMELSAGNVSGPMHALELRRTKVASLGFLAGVTQLPGGLALSDNPRLEALAMPNCTVVGDIAVHNNIALRSLALPQVARTGAVHVSWTPLVELVLPAAQVDGDLRLEKLTALTRLPLCPLRSVAGAVQLEGVGLCRSFLESALRPLEATGTSVTIEQCGQEACPARCCNNGDQVLHGMEANCTCWEGWVGASCLTDVDECAGGAHTCGPLATCSNTAGSFQCACNAGFVGDGIECQDYCAADASDCHTDAECQPTPGSFACTCNAGFLGDGVTCSDYCAAGAHNCHHGAECAVSPGSFTCACADGWTGDGVVCSSVDECELGSHNCHTQAVCTDVEGSFQCACETGWTGSGVACSTFRPLDVGLSTRASTQQDRRITAEFTLPQVYPHEPNVTIAVRDADHTLHAELEVPLSSCSAGPRVECTVGAPTLTWAATYYATLTLAANGSTSDASLPSNVATLCAPPSAPATLLARPQGGYTHVQLTWEEPTHQGHCPLLNYSVELTGAASSTHHTPHTTLSLPVPPHTSFSAVVRAWNACGRGGGLIVSGVNAPSVVSGSLRLAAPASPAAITLNQSCDSLPPETQQAVGCVGSEWVSCVDPLRLLPSSALPNGTVVGSSSLGGDLLCVDGGFLEPGKWTVQLGRGGDWWQAGVDITDITSLCVETPPGALQHTHRLGLRAANVLSGIGFNQSDVGGVFSYPAPTVTPRTMHRLGEAVVIDDVFNVARVDATSTMPETIVIEGSNFGALSAGFGGHVTVTLGNWACTSCDTVQTVNCAVSALSDSQLTCVTDPAGSVGLVELGPLVCVGSQCSARPAMGDTYDRFSFPQAPMITDLFVPHGLQGGCVGEASAAACRDPTLFCRVKHCPTRGDTQVGLLGANFSPDIATRPDVFVTLVGTVASSVAPVTRINKTGEMFEIVFTIPAGVGSAGVQFIQGYERSNAFYGLSYAAPTVLSVHGCPATSGSDTLDCAMDGGDAISLTGRDFGHLAPQVLIGSSFCGSPSLPQRHQDGTETVSCSVGAGVGQDLLVALVQGSGVISQGGPALSFERCPPGQFLVASEHRCANCSAGFFNPSEGQLACGPCPVGAYSLEGADQCRACDEGSYQDEPAQSCCKACGPGTFTAATGQFICTQCSPGSFQAGSGSSACVPCPEGSEAPAGGAWQCALCDPGSFAASNGTVRCSLCDAGTHQPNSGEASCEPCTPGSAQPLPGQTACDPCGPGTHAPSHRSLLCQNCTAGRFRHSGPADRCAPCPAGHFQDEEGQAGCKPCAPGTSQTQEEGLTCTPCEAGTVQPLGGQDACVACEAGFYQHEAGKSECLPCPPGQFAAFSRSTACVRCDPGHFRRADGPGHTCEECAPGSSQPDPGMPSCEPCGLGTSGGEGGLAACRACEVGWFQNETGQTGCTRCPKGAFQPFPGREGCELAAPGHFTDKEGEHMQEACAEGTYQELAGQSSCVACEPGYFLSDPASAEPCRPCRPGTISTMQRATECVLCPSQYEFTVECAQSECAVCPTFAHANANRTGCECDGGFYEEADEAEVVRLFGDEADLYTQTNSSAGFYCIPCPRSNGTAPASRCTCARGMFDSMRRAHEGLRTCEPCPEGATCDDENLALTNLTLAAGYWRSNRTSLAIHKCFRLAHCPGGEPFSDGGMCEFPRVGALCAKCASDYYAPSFSSGCESCFSDGASWWWATAIFLLGCLGLLGLFVVMIKASSHDEASAQRTLRQAFRQAEATEDGSPPVFTHETRAALSFTYPIKIVLAFFQVATSLTLLVSIPWPSSFVALLDYLSFINFDFIPWQSLECVTRFSFYTKLMLTITVPAGILIGGTLLFGISLALLDRFDYSDDPRQREKREGWWRDFVKLLLFSLFLLYPKVSSSLLSFFACRSVDNHSFLVADFNLECYTAEWMEYLPFAVIGILIYPVGIPLAFFFILYRQRRRGRLNTPECRRSLGFLYEAYDISMFWWEIVEMAIKLVLTGLLVFLPPGLEVRGGLVALTAYMLVLLVANPFVRATDHTMAMLAYTELFHFLLAGLVLETREVDWLEDIAMSVLLYGIMVVLLGAAVYFGAIFLRRLVRRQKRKKMQLSSSQARMSAYDTFSAQKADAIDCLDEFEDNDEELFPDEVDPEDLSFLRIG